MALGTLGSWLLEVIKQRQQPFCFIREAITLEQPNQMVLKKSSPEFLLHLAKPFTLWALRSPLPPLNDGQV